MSKCRQMTKMQCISGFLALCIFLLLVTPCSGNADYQTVKVFKDGVTTVSYKGDSRAKTERKPGKFRVPAFVGNVLNNKEFLAIICGAHFQESSGGNPITGVAKTSYGNNKQWTEAESFTENDQKDTTHRLLGDFTAVMHENKIYVLTTSTDSSEISKDSAKSDKWWDAAMFIGTVTQSTVAGISVASIKWDKVKSFKDAALEVVKKAQATYFVGGESNGIVTKRGAIAFPIRMDQPNNKMTSSILYSSDDGKTWKIGGKSEIDTYSGSLVEWKDDKLLYIVVSGGGYRKVFESKDMGTTWDKSIVFSGVWGNEPNRTGYGGQGSAIKVPMDGKDMLLFAHPLSEKGSRSIDTLQLWLSDGQRVVCVGTISDEKKEEQTGNSILAHVGNHLYITHEINPHKVQHSTPAKPKEWDGVIGLTSLSKFFESAKTKVLAWRELDTKYKTRGIPTDGLVGLLESSKDKSVWEDVYKCVDATVIGGESVSGGFRFNGAADSGAMWPVGSQGQNQVYIFAEKQFTLAATVTVHDGKEKGHFELLGASWDSQGEKMLLGIGYTNDNKWCAVSRENKQITTEKVFEREKEYHVTLTRENDAASVYVDGVEIANTKLKVQKTDSISHFYIGGLEQSSTAKGSALIVKNVMLFNRALKKEEISKLTQVTKDNTLEKQTNISQHDIRDIALKKDTNGDIGTVLSSSVGFWTCLICLIFALTGF